MLIVRNFSLQKPKLSLSKLGLPMLLELEDGVRAEVSNLDDNRWRLTIHESVDPDSLSLVTETGWFREDATGGRTPIPQVECRTNSTATSLLASQITSSIAFLLDADVHLSSLSPDDRLVPESEEDEAQLEELGTRELFSQSVITTMGGSVTGLIEADAVGAALRQQAGVRLYHGALRSADSTTKFREFCKVLESAFANTDDKLLDLLIAFAPIVDMGVDRDELHDLLVLRGRASHAQSKAGLAEQVHVENQCRSRAGRLKKIAEVVIENKAHWGYPTSGSTEVVRAGLRKPLDEITL